MKDFLRTRVAPGILAGIIKFLVWSMDLRIEDPHGVFIEGRKRKGALFVFWHNRMLILVSAYRMMDPWHRLHVLISKSKDGQMVADVMKHFDVGAVRASSSRQGSLGLRELIRLVGRDDSDVVVTPDGPRGPRYEFQRGVLVLSQMTGRPVVPVSMEFSSMKELPSWDRFRIPLPFCRGVVKFGRPVTVPEEVSETELEDITRRLSEVMNAGN